MYQKGGYKVNKIKVSLNLSPDVYDLLKKQAREKGLDNGSYITFLVHEKNREKEFQDQLKELFLSMLKR